MVTTERHILMYLYLIFIKMREADLSDGTPPSGKLLLDATGKAIDNPTVQVQPIFKGVPRGKNSSGSRA
jgi:hypothetical protein